MCLLKYYNGIFDDSINVRPLKHTFEYIPNQTKNNIRNKTWKYYKKEHFSTAHAWIKLYCEYKNIKFKFNLKYFGSLIYARNYKT